MPQGEQGIWIRGTGSYFAKNEFLEDIRKKDGISGRGSSTFFLGLVLIF